MCACFKCSVLLFVLLNNAYQIGCDCTLSLKNDFGSPQPILIQNGGFLAPNADRAIVVQNAKIITVACTGNNGFVFLGNDTLKENTVQAHCKSGNTFRVGDWEGPFKNITCNRHPTFTAEWTPEECYGNNKIVRNTPYLERDTKPFGYCLCRHAFPFTEHTPPSYLHELKSLEELKSNDLLACGDRVGYKVDQFYTLYEACFDENLQSTLYVRHVIGPFNYFQLAKRPAFVEAGMFGKTRISQYYKAKNQKERLNVLLGEDMDKVYHTNKQFLTRGHLAPRVDFPLVSAQRASFAYINTAPQWLKGNSGDWAALEDAVRRRVKRFGGPIKVYTGTFGVSTLADKLGVQREIFLRSDENNNMALPVPMYFYKVIYDPAHKSAVAFVSINSSYYNATQIEELMFCSDICDGDANYNWLRWRNDDTTSFCCDYNEFSETVHHLKGLDLDVESTFY